MWALLLFVSSACRVQPAATSGHGKDDLSGSGVSTCPSCDDTCEIDHLPVDESPHVEGDIEYPTLPPAGGPHNPCWYEFGIHEEAVPAERWVHNLEHGAIVFLYNCPDGCPDEVAALTILAQDLGPWVLMTPYPDMDWRFAAVAWENRILVNCLDTDAMGRFYEEHVNNAPESVLSDPAEGCMD